MSIFLVLSRWLERILLVICCTILTSLAVLVIVAVGLRTVGRPLGWYDEVATIMLAWLTYYGAALAALYRAHLGFPGFVAVMKPNLRVALLLVSDLLIIGFFALVAYFGFQIIQILQGDYLVSIRWVPISFTQSVIPIGACLFILAQILTFPARLEEAAVGNAPPEPEDQLADPSLPAGDHPVIDSHDRRDAR